MQPGYSQRVQSVAMSVPFAHKTFALDSKLADVLSVHPGLRTTQEPSDILALESKFRAAVSVHPVYSQVAEFAAARSSAEASAVES